MSENLQCRSIATLGSMESGFEDALSRYCEDHGGKRLAIQSESELDRFVEQGMTLVVFNQLPDATSLAQNTLEDCRDAPYAKILVCNHASIPLTICAIRMGYHYVLDQLPSQEVIERLLQEAFETAACRVKICNRKQRMVDILDNMTKGELLVLRSVVDGHLNKRIAKRLEISERTVEARRKRIFEKTETTSVAMLVRSIVESVGVDELYRRCGEHLNQTPPPHLNLSSTAAGSKMSPISPQRGC